MRRLRYSSLSDTGLSNSGERPAQRSEAAYCDKESLIWDREEIEVQRKFPAEYRSDSLNAISDDGNRKKIGGVEKERLERENIWLRNRLSAANMKLRELKEQEDRTSGSSCNLSISSNRSSKSKMRCSVLGRKKKKAIENDLSSDASTIVMGSKSKPTSIDGNIIKHKSARPLKKKCDSLWNRYLGRSRRDLSPRRFGSQTPDITPPCTPERLTPRRLTLERSPRKDDWSSTNNRNRNLISPSSSNILRQSSQEGAHIYDRQLLGIEACLSNTRIETREKRENMFMSFRTAVNSEIFTVEKLKATNTSTLAEI